MNENKKSIIKKDDTTKYGEFISSYFTWLTLEGQKEKAKQLEKITKKENKKL